MKNSLFVLALLMILAVSCRKDDNDGPAKIWKDSVFIVNEGPFQDGTGSVMAYNRQTDEVSGDLFEQANGRPLGNIVQSMAVYRDLVWIVVNKGNKIEIARLKDFVSVATIEDINLPRYVVFKDDKAYVSSWDNKIIVIDVNSYGKLGELPAGEGPDEMIITGEYLFAVNAGGFGTGHSVTFVNTSDEEIYGEIGTGDRPSGIVKDKNGKLWVLCSGRGWNGFPEPETDTPGSLVCIDPETRTIISEYPFPDTDKHPDQLIISEDGSTLFYSYTDGIYSFDPDAPELAAAPFIPSATMFYALGFDPVGDMIYASDPIDYAQNGRVYRYHWLDGSEINSIEAGIIPGGFWFNK